MTLTQLVWAVAAFANFWGAMTGAVLLGRLCADYLWDQDPDTLKWLLGTIAVFVGVLAMFVFSLAMVVSG